MRAAALGHRGVGGLDQGPVIPAGAGHSGARHWAGSDVQDRGKYSARSMNADPAAAA